MKIRKSPKSRKNYSEFSYFRVSDFVLKIDNSDLRFLEKNFRDFGDFRGFRVFVLAVLLQFRVIFIFSQVTRRSAHNVKNDVLTFRTELEKRYTEVVVHRETPVLQSFLKKLVG